MKKDCCIVVHRNYAEGTSAYAFYDRADAEKCIKEDVDIVLKDLREMGYKPMVLSNVRIGYEVYVPHTNILYEWDIFESTIE